MTISQIISERVNHLEPNQQLALLGFLGNPRNHAPAKLAA